MDQNEQVIFAVLERKHFDAIVAALARHFGEIEYGSQGDDWIWIERRDVRIAIDSFFSMQLDVKGPRRGYGLAQEILSLMKPEWIETVYAPPITDPTQ